jgi:hypothetical protein
MWRRENQLPGLHANGVAYCLALVLIDSLSGTLAATSISSPWKNENPRNRSRALRRTEFVAEVAPLACRVAVLIGRLDESWDAGE